MSEETLATNVEGAAPAKADSVEDWTPPSKEEIERLRSTNERLLRESKKYRSEAVELKQFKSEIEQKQMEEQGKYKEMASMYEKKYKELENQVMVNNVQSHIRKLALDKKAKYPDLVINNINQDMIQYDPQTGEVHGADLAVEDLQKRFPDLFGGEERTPAINPMKPGGAVGASPKLTAADAAKLDKAEFNKLLEAAWKREGKL